MNPEQLHARIRAKQSFLCVGLDTDIDKIPKFLLTHEDPVFEFNRQVVEATKDYAVAYKINTAFYEARGLAGWQSLEKTLDIIPDDIFTIADAKRGDIGNTSSMYAKTFFETYDFDAVTVAPYMGRDSVAPFLAFEGKWVFLLALTSNSGAQDFQWMREDGQTLYSKVIRTSLEWERESPGHLGFVVGATQSDYIAEVRELAPDNFFLVPGVGAQGGDLDAVIEAGQNKLGGLLINSSRGIIYSGKGASFAYQAGESAKELQMAMAEKD